MKKILFFFAACLLTVVMANAQSGPVKWNFSAKKLSANTYEVRMTATISGDEWHIYSQTTGEGPVPTSFTFTKNPLLSLDGKVKEVGKMIKKHEEAFGSEVHYYERTVDFVQVVKVKGKAKTNLAGKVEYMVCNDHECLPPAEQEFKIPIGG